MRKHWLVLLFFLGISLLLPGCEGTDFTDVTTDTQGNVRSVGSNTIVYQDNVRLLQPDSGVEVAEITGDRVVLTGPVPTLAVGDVIVRGEGPSQFTRRVAAVTTEGDRVVVTTARVGLNDIFQEADIQETITLGRAFSESLEPAIPGVTISVPEGALAQGREFLTPSAVITFNEAIVAEDNRGSIKLDGSLGLSVGIRTDLQVGVQNFIVPTVNRFELTPLVDITGDLNITGQGSGNFRKEFPISQPFSYPLAGFGGLGLNMQGRLMVVIDGYVQADGAFSLNDVSVRLEGGVRYENGQWGLVNNIIPTIPTPAAPQLNAEANLGITVLQPKLALNLCDMGEISVKAQMLKLEAEARFAAAPSPRYNVSLYRTTGLEIGADFDVGIAPINVGLHETLPIFSGERVLLTSVGVPLPAPSSNDVYVIIPPVNEGGVENTNTAMKVGEERLLWNLTFIRLGALLIVPIQLPCRWNSSDRSIVELTDYSFFAIARALRPGEVEITAARPSGVTGYLRQRVGTTEFRGFEIVPGLTVGLGGFSGQQVRAQTSGSIAVPKDGSRDFKAIGTYADGSRVDLTYAVNWSTGIESAQAFRNGQVDGRQTGATQLTVTDPVTGRTASTAIEVVRPPIAAMSIYPVSPAKIEVTGGESVQLRASARYGDGSVREVTRSVNWVSSDPSIARVQNGLVTTEQSGQVLIKAVDPQGDVFASKTIVINRAALASLRLRPASAGPFRIGQTQQFRATAVFADRTESSATNDVIWSSTNTSAAKISKEGLVTIVGPGTFRVKALMNRVSASTPEFEAEGPAGLVYSVQPVDVASGEPFSVTVEVRDGKDQLWTEPVPVTLELAEGPANASLGGNLTVNSVAGRATFPDLTINQVGEGYTLRAVSSGLSIATSNTFEGLTPGGGTGARGHVFVNETTAVDGVGGLTVLEVSGTGAFTEAVGSPYNTAGTASAMTKVGNFVVVAIGGTGANKNSLQTFSYDSATGGLTAVGQSATDSIATSSPAVLKIDSGGGNLVVSLSMFDNLLKAWRVGNDGSLTLLDTENLVGTTIDQIEYYDAPGTTDYVYLACNSPRQIQAFALDTVGNTLTPVVGSPFNHLFTAPGAMETVGANLFVVNPGSDPTPNGLDNMYWYTINNSTGALSLTSFFWGVGDRPVGIHAVGDLLFIGNQVSADITSYRVLGNEMLESLDGGVFVPAGEINPHSFADVVLSSEESGLYVATSNSIAAFLLNTTTGALTSLAGSPFGGYSSPGDLAR